MPLNQLEWLRVNLRIPTSQPLERKRQPLENGIATHIRTNHLTTWRCSNISSVFRKMTECPALCQPKQFMLEPGWWTCQKKLAQQPDMQSTCWWWVVPSRRDCGKQNMNFPLRVGWSNHGRCITALGWRMMAEHPPRAQHKLFFFCLYI